MLQNLIDRIAHFLVGIHVAKYSRDRNVASGGFQDDAVHLPVVEPGLHLRRFDPIKINHASVLIEDASAGPAQLAPPAIKLKNASLKQQTADDKGQRETCDTCKCIANLARQMRQVLDYLVQEGKTEWND